MRRVIETQFLPATDTRGPRVVAISELSIEEGVIDVSVAYDYALDRDAMHTKAAREMLSRLRKKTSRKLRIDGPFESRLADHGYLYFVTSEEP